MTTPTDGPVGICVSGGGLRAASFGLGALQALQYELRLLRGERSADYLSAVSGGSYVAGAYTLVNCSDRIRPKGGGPDERGAAPPAQASNGAVPPLAYGAPELEHLRRHCRYMVEDGGVRTVSRMLVLMLVNLLIVVSLVIWAGFMLGACATLGALVLPAELDSPDGNAAFQWALGAVAVAMLLYGVRRLGRLTPGPATPLAFVRRLAVAVLLAAPLCVGAASLTARLTTVPVLETPDWVLDHAVPILLVIAGLAVGTGTLELLGRNVRRGAPTLQRISRAGVALLTLRLVQAVGILIVAWMAVWITKASNEEEGSLLTLVLVFGVMLAPILLQPFIDRTTPHHPYRDLLTRCFSVIRTSDGGSEPPHAPIDVRLSELAPPPPGRPDSFPELLICAAANLSDVGATPAGTNALSLVLTPRHLHIPAANVSMPIQHLERYRRPTSLTRGWGPGITLASAVAMTGAAVSPAMGKRTRNDLRALFATLNIRLGVWLPNVLRDSERDRAAAVRDGEQPRIKVSIDEMVAELFGTHESTGRMLYVSDGGHYDNLGLVELLRRRCRTIVCIDASGDVPGRATALADAMLIAGGDVGARVSLELDRFALADERKLKDAIVTHTHAVGTVEYPDNTVGTILVVKLGLTADSPDELHEYRRSDRAFPHHSTLNQVFRVERFDAYRTLGWDSMCRALADPEVATAAPLLRPLQPA